MIKRLISLLLVMCIALGAAPLAAAEEVPGQEEVYAAIMALQENYPEGHPWTNEDSYDWNGGVYTGGFGCVAFAFLLSDAAFGTLPARKLTDITIDDVRAGDILRVDDDGHSVIVLQVESDHVVIAEGNYIETVHWGRSLSAEEVAQADYMLTRYPEDAPTEPGQYAITVSNGEGGTAVIESQNVRAGDTVTVTVTPSEGYVYDSYALNTDLGEDVLNQIFSEMSFDPEGGTGTFTMPELDQGYLEFTFWFILPGDTPFRDVTGDHWFHDTVVWAVESGITTGISETAFAPDDTCTRNQVVTFLWRANGSPEPASAENPFVDVKESDYFYKAVLWAVENGITTGMDATHFDPERPCTRAQVVTFLHRTAGRPFPASEANPFDDVPWTDGTDWYYNAVVWAVGEEITTGITETTFVPDGTCTRAQIVTFLYRFQNN